MAKTQTPYKCIGIIGTTYSKLYVFISEIISSNTILSLLVVYYDNYDTNYNQ